MDDISNEPTFQFVHPISEYFMGLKIQNSPIEYINMITRYCVKYNITTTNGLQEHFNTGKFKEVTTTQLKY